MCDDHYNIITHGGISEIYTEKKLKCNREWTFARTRQIINGQHVRWNCFASAYAPPIIIAPETKKTQKYNVMMRKLWIVHRPPNESD